LVCGVWQPEAIIIIIITTTAAGSRRWLPWNSHSDGRAMVDDGTMEMFSCRETRLVVRARPGK
jgi:hypothetical protein